MDFLTDWLTDWLKELLIGGIMGNLEGSLITSIPKSERLRYRWGLPRRRGTPGYFPSSASFPKR